MNPKHPPKVVVVVSGGLVSAVYMDKDVDVRVYIADYDNKADESSVDMHGEVRSLEEAVVWVDTMEIRKILNKKGGGKSAAADGL